MEFLPLPAVQKRVGLGRTAIYQLIQEGKFPRPVKQGTSSRWVDIEIDAYQARVMSERPASPTTSASS
jgi:prophage regulatory protein